MIKIAICDDAPKELERAHNFLMKYIQEHSYDEVQIVTFTTPLELLSYVEEAGGFDIFILDIYMMGMLGTDAARELRQIDDKGEIIFVTSSRDHAIDAFEVDAANYLIKPYTENSIFSALDKVLKRLTLERRHLITLKTSEGIIRIFSRDVVYTETGRNNYQIIHTITGEKLMVRMTATELFNLLYPANFFVRCGVSINLNLRGVQRKDN